MAEQVKKGIQRFQFNGTPHHITAAELFLRILRGETYNAENPKGYFTTIIKRKVLQWKQRRENQLNQLEQGDDGVWNDIPDHNDVEEDIVIANEISCLKDMVTAFAKEYNAPGLNEDTIKAYRAMAKYRLDGATNVAAAEMARKAYPNCTHAEETLRAQFPHRMREFIVRRFGRNALNDLLG